MIIAALFALALQPAGTCAAVTPRLMPVLRRTEAARVSRLSRHRVRPADVSYVMAEGNWRLVFATPTDAERGVFVMRRAGRDYRLVDVWGGVMSPEDHGQAAAWARELAGGGVPVRLANCMDQAIMSGR